MGKKTWQVTSQKTSKCPVSILKGVLYNLLGDYGNAN